MSLRYDLSNKSALRFIILTGIVSLFSDMTYEGARSITGPYLAQLGANAAIVGFVSGFGELLGYALRMASGYLADRTGKYWTITILGYACNVLAVPLLALAGNWWMASILMVTVGNTTRYTRSNEDRLRLLDVFKRSCTNRNWIC